MDLNGIHAVGASAQNIWEKLMDPEALARITPGVSRLELKDENQYKAIAKIKMGPVNGSFSGDLEVAEKNEPESFILKISQNSKIGNVAAEINIQLKALNEGETEVSFNGKARLSGLLARTGQRVLSGVANTLSKQFFSALEKEFQDQNTDETLPE